MMNDSLVKLFEHNNWANAEIIRACAALTDAQLDAEPVSATKGSIRETLRHLVASQQGYLSTLTGTDYRAYWQAPPPLAEMQENARVIGDKFVALTRGELAQPDTRLQTRDGYFVEPWVLMVQVINHATEHREQIKSMLSALGVTPPELDAWTYGEVTHALVPASSS